MGSTPNARSKRSYTDKRERELERGAGQDISLFEMINSVTLLGCLFKAEKESMDHESITLHTDNRL